MSRNLITGGLGFVGSYLARELVGRGEEVVLFDVVAASRLIGDIAGRVKIIRGDLADWSQVLEAVKSHDIQVIYHAGALLSGSAEGNPQAAYRVNVNGTFHILEAAQLFEVESVIFCSTDGTYGPGIPPVVNDDVIQTPLSIYGVTKVCCERLGEYYWRRYGVNFRGVRFPSLMGVGRGIGGISAYCSLIVQEPALGRPYRVLLDESTRTSLLYIKDAVQALIALQQAGEPALERRIYNIQGFASSTLELAEMVRRYVPGAEIEFCPDRAIVEMVRSWPREMDDSRARREWGWQPRYDLEAAVRDFVAELRANHGGEK